MDLRPIYDVAAGASVLSRRTEMFGEVWGGLEGLPRES